MKTDEHAQARLNQISPFNEVRFDVCMAYLSRKHGRSLTQYDMVKLHLMTDVFHTLEHGKPVIGGAVQAWDFGPLVPDAYNRLRHWTYKFDESGFQPESLSIVDRRGRSWEFLATQPVDAADFSPSELAAMDRAWDAIMGLDWTESQAYFHERSFVGRAWSHARREGRDMDWNEIIDEYDAEHRTDHGHIKSLIRF